MGRRSIRPSSPPRVFRSSGLSDEPCGRTRPIDPPSSPSGSGSAGGRANVVSRGDPPSSPGSLGFSADDVSSRAPASTVASVSPPRPRSHRFGGGGGRTKNQIENDGRRRPASPHYVSSSDGDEDDGDDDETNEDRIRRLREEREARRYAEERRKERLSRKQKRRGGGGDGDGGGTNDRGRGGGTGLVDDVGTMDKQIRPSARSSSRREQQPDYSASEEQAPARIRGSASREPHRRGRDERYIVPPSHGSIGVDPIRVERSRSRDPRGGRGGATRSRSVQSRGDTTIATHGTRYTAASRGTQAMTPEDDIGGDYTPDASGCLPAPPRLIGGCFDAPASSPPGSPPRDLPTRNNQAQTSQKHLSSTRGVHRSRDSPPAKPSSPVEEYLRKFEDDSTLVKVVILSSSAYGGGDGEGCGDDVFTVPASLVVKREREMRKRARQFGIGDDRWNGSLLARKLQEVALEKEMRDLEKKMQGLGLPGRGGGNGVCDTASGKNNCNPASSHCGTGLGNWGCGDDDADHNDLIDEGNEPYTFILDPETECGPSITSDSESGPDGGEGTVGIGGNGSTAHHDGPDFDWTPSLTSCVSSYYNTGAVRVPDACLGNDVLLALEYFGIVYAPDQLAFDSFGCYLRVKLWSDYYTQRGAVAEWVVKRLMEGRSRHSHSFVTSPDVGEGEEAIYVGSKKCDVLEGGLSLPAGETGRPPKSCSVVHEFFNDDDDDRTPNSRSPHSIADASTIRTDDDSDTPPIDALLRDDFCAYVQSSLPGTLVTFRPREVALGTRGLKVTRAVLRIDFDPRKAKVRSSRAKNAAREKSVVVVNKDTSDGTVVSALEEEVEVQSFGELSKKSSATLKLAIARATALATLDEDEEGTSNGLEIDPHLPVRTVKGYNNGGPGNEDADVDNRSLVSALTSTFREGEDGGLLTPRGGAAAPAAAVPATPGPSDKTQAAAATPATRSTTGTDPNFNAVPDPAAQKYLGNWVVEEENRPISMVDLSAMAQSLLPAELVNGVAAGAAAASPLEQMKGLMPTASTDTEKTDNKTPPGSPSRNTGGAANRARGAATATATGNSGSLDDVVDAIQSLTTSITAAVMGAVNGEEEKKEPFFEYVDQKEEAAAVGAGASGAGVATVAAAGGAAVAATVATTRKLDPPTGSAASVRSTGSPPNQEEKKEETTASGPIIQLQPIPSNASNSSPGRNTILAGDHTSAAQQQSRAALSQAQQQQGQQQQPPSEGKKSLDDVSAEWLRDFFSAPLNAGIDCMLTAGLIDSVPEPPEACQNIGTGADGEGGVGEMGGMCAFTEAIERAAAMGMNERSDVSCAGQPDPPPTVVIKETPVKTMPQTPATPSTESASTAASTVPPTLEDIEDAMCSPTPSGYSGASLTGSGDGAQPRALEGALDEAVYAPDDEASASASASLAERPSSPPPSGPPPMLLPPASPRQAVATPVDSSASSGVEKGASCTPPRHPSPSAKQSSAVAAPSSSSRRGKGGGGMTKKKSRMGGFFRSKKSDKKQEIDVFN